MRTALLPGLSMSGERRDKPMRSHMADLDNQITPSDRFTDELRRAVRCVASAAADRADCALLLDVLGLDPAAGRVTATPRSS